VVSHVGSVGSAYSAALHPYPGNPRPPHEPRRAQLHPPTA